MAQKATTFASAAMFIRKPLRADLRTGASDLRAKGFGTRADELEQEADLSGRLPNSAARSTTLGAGIAFIDTGGNLGVSVQRFDTRYGVPGRPTTGLDEGERPVAIDLAQTRVDFRGEKKLSGFLNSIQFRGAYADYHHVELEGDEIGTRFAGKGIEFRTDLVQSTHSGWRGRSCVQYLTRTLSVTGEEAVVPDYQIDRIGFFTLQSLAIGGGFELEVAGRYDQSKLRSNEADYSRNFDLFAGALGASWKSPGGFSLGTNFVHGERAPSPEELLSDGIHVATQSFEKGDPALVIEKSNGFEAYARYSSTRVDLSLTGFLTDFDSYVAPLATGETIEDFPVYEYAGSRPGSKASRRPAASRRLLGTTARSDSMWRPIIQVRGSRAMAPFHVSLLCACAAVRKFRSAPCTCAARLNGTTVRTVSVCSRLRPIPSPWST